MNGNSGSVYNLPNGRTPYDKDGDNSNDDDDDTL